MDTISVSLEIDRDNRQVVCRTDMDYNVISYDYDSLTELPAILHDYMEDTGLQD